MFTSPNSCATPTIALDWRFVILSLMVSLIVADSSLTDVYLSKWLCHPLSRTQHIIARLHHRRLRIRAEPGVNIILDAISCHLHALNFARPVSAITGLWTVLPSFWLPTEVWERIYILKYGKKTEIVSQNKQYFSKWTFRSTAGLNNRRARRMTDICPFSQAERKLWVKFSPYVYMIFGPLFFTAKTNFS